VLRQSDTGAALLAAIHEAIHAGHREEGAYAQLDQELRRKE